MGIEWFDWIAKIKITMDHIDMMEQGKPATQAAT
jgi:hypothetical protein